VVFDAYGTPTSRPLGRLLADLRARHAGRCGSRGATIRVPSLTRAPAAGPRGGGGRTTRRLLGAHPPRPRAASRRPGRGPRVCRRPPGGSL